MMQHAFFALAEQLQDGLTGGEVLFATLGAEDSDFVRLNRNRVRQAGHVRSAVLGLQLVDGERQAEASCDLTGEAAEDLPRARRLLGRLRERLRYVPPDPYLQYCAEPSTGSREVGEPLPATEQVMEVLTSAAAGLDLVGIWAAGEQVDGLASSLGHRHWHASRSFGLDWSGYLEGDKALKAGYAGLAWDAEVLGGLIAGMRAGLQVMARPSRRLEPGRYRAYLAPAAVRELMELLAWGGFDLESHRTRETPLLKLIQGERRLDPRILIREDQGRGLTPAFTPEGFVKPSTVTLIERGLVRDCLVDARSGRKYGLAVNAAGETPESLALDGGDLPRAEVLTRLGTGLYIGNLWYCNWSDPNECRITGMTRFGTYWVEDGELVAPVSAMRFDDSLYHLLGDRLDDLTRERELFLSAETYDGRSTDSALLPGVLVSGIELTL